MSGAIPTFPNTSLWRSAQLSTGTNLIYLTKEERKKQRRKEREIKPEGRKEGWRKKEMTKNCKIIKDRKK
jgi:hypothetical protein